VKAVVDTNVVAYYVLGTEDFSAETVAFWHRASQAIAPALWEAEIANVVWMAARRGYLTGTDASRSLRSASQLGIRSVPMRSLWHAALLRAIDSDVAVYDTLFVELAARARLPLVTFDARLLDAFPEIAVRPGKL